MRSLTGVSCAVSFPVSSSPFTALRGVLRTLGVAASSRVRDTRLAGLKNGVAEFEIAVAWEDAAGEDVDLFWEGDAAVLVLELKEDELLRLDNEGRGGRPGKAPNDCVEMSSNEWDISGTRLTAGVQVLLGCRDCSCLASMVCTMSWILNGVTGGMSD